MPVATLTVAAEADASGHITTRACPSHRPAEPDDRCVAIEEVASTPADVDCICPH
jgi:hypothetical protein